MNPKLSEQLRAQLTQPDASDILEVIIELHDASEPPAQQTQSRQEKIAALKESFAREIAPLEDMVRSLGGEVTGHAWINRSVRARLPLEKVKQLSASEQIAKIDLPHRLTLEA
jgi:hypothetical protein